MKTEHPWKITIGSQEELVIPQPLAALAQFTNGKSFDVAVNTGQIVITEKQSLRGLVDQFILETQKEIGHLKPTDTWNDEMTVGQYLFGKTPLPKHIWKWKTKRRLTPMPTTYLLDKGIVRRLSEARVRVLN